MRLDSRFYLGDVFGTPTGIFRAGNILYTQKPCNVSSITHACVHACPHVYALLENPLVKRPDANLHRDFALTRAAVAECRAYAFRAHLFIFSPRSIFFPLFRFLRWSKKRSKGHEQETLIVEFAITIPIVQKNFRIHKFAIPYWNPKLQSVSMYALIRSSIHSLPPHIARTIHNFNVLDYSWSRIKIACNYANLLKKFS